MKAHVGIAIATGALATALAAPALAQQQQYETTPQYMRAPLRAPSEAFELGINTGYTQGFGDIESGQSVGSEADAGLGVGLDLGFRARPEISVGITGQYQEFNPDNSLGNGANARGLTAGLGATFHIAPYDRVNPFVTLGTGYRLLWTMPVGPANDALTHGFQLAKLNLGLDWRVSDDVALGPMVGADLNMFLWRNPEGERGNYAIDDVSVNTFLYGGVQGRFDVGGTRTTQIREVARR
ncbi:MAG: hypothetical protein IT372_21450 [Polyangiaceae bacterium]|nr:hypothetical protein [Polyangiaceae bacterium]